MLKFKVLLFVALMAFLLLSAPLRAQGDGIAKAYQKEYAFLEAEKRVLSARLKDLDKTAASKEAAARGEIGALQRQLIALRAQVDQLEMDLDAEKRISSSAEERTDLLMETMERANESMQNFDFRLPTPSKEAEIQAIQIVNLLKKAAVVMEDGEKIKVEKGSFFLPDGKKTEGQVLRIGRIASYGMTERAGGVLAPAGGSRLKLWNSEAHAVATKMMKGERPTELPIFLYESLEQGVEKREEKTVLSIIQSGGIIEWVIVGLGVLGMLMIIARIFILVRAGTRTGKLIRAVGSLVDDGRSDEAVKLLNKAKGSAASVLRATIGALDFEKDKLEDTVSEAILHETPKLEKFGAPTLVIAAVAPLLGLLGTVTGMISTFDVITEYGTGDPKMLSGGISEALVTTELGLIVAIPTLLIGTLLAGRSNAILETMERAALHIMNKSDSFKRRRKRNSMAPPPKDESKESKEEQCTSEPTPEGAPA